MIQSVPRPTYELLERISIFMLVNILWMIFAAPLLTLPLATAGLFAVLTPWVQGHHPELFQTFFGAMWRYRGKSALLGLGNLAVALLVYLNFQIFSHMNMATIPALLSLNVTVFVLAMAAMMNSYTWVLLVTVDLPLPRLLKTAFKLVLLHPAWSALVTMLALLPLLGIFLLPGGIILLGMVAGSAWIASWGAWQVLEQYMVNDQLKADF